MKTSIIPFLVLAILQAVIGDTDAAHIVSASATSEKTEAYDPDYSRIAKRDITLLQKTKRNTAHLKKEDPKSNEICTCEYFPIDENLVAYANGKRLEFQDKIRKDSTVTFRCKLMGYHELQGPRTKVCKDCRPWKSPDLPKCLKHDDIERESKPDVPGSEGEFTTVKNGFGSSVNTTTVTNPESGTGSTTETNPVSGTGGTTETNPESGTDGTTETNRTLTPAVECFCKYVPKDENLFAYTDENQLQFGDSITPNTTVNFRCKKIGLHRIDGPTQMKCENCNVWDSDVLPRCLEPEHGSTKIFFNETIDISKEGYLQIRNGQRVRLTCVVEGANKYPRWSFPVESKFRITRERISQKEEYIHVSHIDIENANVTNKGQYGCYVRDNPAIYLRIVLVNSCKIPSIKNGEVGRIERTVFSKYKMCENFVSFQEGETVMESKKVILRCHEGFMPVTIPVKFSETLENVLCIDGEWSHRMQCQSTSCLGNPPAVEHAFITVIRDRSHGEVIYYRCHRGYHKIEGRIVCDFGEWKGKPPVCARTDPCSLEDLKSALSQNVLPEEDYVNETVPYDTTVKLVCSDNKFIKGNGLAKCIENGQWKTQRFDCVAGCPSLNKTLDSKLLVNPQKDNYLLGDIITFSCPLGMSLHSQQYQSIMCLENGWTKIVASRRGDEKIYSTLEKVADLVLPECKDGDFSASK